MTVELDSAISEGLPFEPSQQDAILGFVLLDQNFLLQVKDRVNKNWFVDGWTGKTYDLYCKFYDQFGHTPKSDDEFFLSEGVYSQQPLERQKIKSTLIRARSQTENYSLDVLQQGLTGWLQSRIYHKYVSQSATLFNARKFTEAKSVLATAVKELQDISFEGRAPVDFSDPKKLLQKIEARLDGALSMGHPILDRVCNPDSAKGGLLKGDSTVFMSPVNRGKCHGKDTPILMFDGTIKMVQDVVVGDLLMGPDSKPRTVLSTTVGFGDLYRVIPNSGGDTFVCNGDHVLSLKRNSNSPYKHGEIVNISIDDYLLKSKTFKRSYSLWRAGVDFQSKNKARIDPYILGLWLGDGSSANASLTTADLEPEIAWKAWLESNGDLCRVVDQPDNRSKTYCATRLNRTTTGSFRILEDLGVLNNKHIPHDLKTSVKSIRLELLAGLIDSDGHYSKSNSRFEYVSKSKTLSDDVAFIARSLGFKVTISRVFKTCQTGAGDWYFNLNIRGPLSSIPTRIPRKMATDSTKNPLLSGFKIEPIGGGDYYGFTLDGDHLYLLGDFTVTHNTTVMLTIICANLWAGKSVLWITHEGNEVDLTEKIWCCMLNLTKKEFRAMLASNDPTHLQILSAVGQILQNQLIYIDYQVAQKSVEGVTSMARQHQQRRKAKIGSGFDLFADDYPALVGADGLKGISTERRHRDSYVYRYFVDFAAEEGMHGLFNVQTNREGSKKGKKVGDYSKNPQLITLEDIQETFEITNSATNLWTGNRTPQDEAQETITLLNGKSRSSEVNVAVTLRSDFRRARAFWADKPAFWYKGTHHIENAESLFGQYSGQELPYNYKELMNGSPAQSNLRNI